MEKALAVIIGMVALLVFIGQFWLALLVGVAGALVLASIPGEGERPKNFEPVEPFPPGDYPKWDFWKETLEKSGEFFGKVAETFGATGFAVGKWSNFVHEKVFGRKSDAYEYMLPGMIKVDKELAKVQQQVVPRLLLIQELEKMYENAPSLEEKAKIKEEILELEKEIKELMGKYKWKIKD